MNRAAACVPMFTVWSKCAVCADIIVGIEKCIETGVTLLLYYVMSVFMRLSGLIDEFLFMKMWS